MRAVRCDVLLILLACIHREPAPLFAPIRRVDLPQPIEPIARPEDCESADVLHGDPLSWAPAGVATCDGQLVSPSLALELTQVRDLYPLAVEGLRACEDAADLRRAVYEDRLTDERAARRWAEREATGLRLAVPVALVGGVVLGGAAAIGVLAAADGVVGR